MSLDARAQIKSNDYLVEVLKGDVLKAEPIHVLGQNSSVGTTFEDVQPLGGNITFLTAAAVLDVTSDNAADTSAGTGARTIQIDGLDDNFDQISETITMNGLTIVNTTLSFRRVNEVTVITAGSGNENAGVISIKSGANNIASIDATFNSSEEGRITVPNGKVGVVVFFEADAGSGKEIDFRFRAGNGEGIAKTTHVCKVFENTLVVGLSSHIYDEKTDLWFQGKVTTGTAAAIVMFHVVLIDKSSVNPPRFG